MFSTSTIIFGLLGVSIVALVIIYIAVRMSNSATKNIVTDKNEENF